MVGQMANSVNKKQSNPDWIWDEQILAFDVYLEHGVPSKGHPVVIKLSQTLRSLPIHPIEIRGSTFRNPNGVGRKLADIHTHRPGYSGKPTSGSKLDTEVWVKYGDNPELVRSIANTIRNHGQDFQNSVDDEEEIASEHQEGRIVVRLHKTRERNPQLVSKKKQSILKQFGFLSCQACGINLEKKFGSSQFNVYECHHILPLHTSGETKTSINDLALLCPTCHRIAHRIKPWPTIEELKSLTKNLQKGP
jgi:5-methylcytosine-specific restriction protein A